MARENGVHVTGPPLDGRIQMIVPIVRGLAALLGPGCEVALHDISRLPHSIVAIENGALTGRELGDGPTDRALRCLYDGDRAEDVHVHVAARDGRVLKSLLVTLRTQEGEAFGLLGLTLDISELVQAQRAIAGVTSLNGGGELGMGNEEFGGGDIRDVVDGMISRIVGAMGKTPRAMSRAEKMEVVRRLEGHGAFLVKRSAEQVADALDLSRYTVFSYLKEIRRGEPGRREDC